MKYMNIFVNQCYQAKEWKQNNGWIENSDGLLLTEDRGKIHLTHLQIQEGKRIFQ